MTDRFYGVDIGGDMPSDVTEASSTTSKNIELRVTYDATGQSKLTVLLALEALTNYVSQDIWPPV
ncbi:MAG: hypothetical protein U1F35_05370 [Steroidobacteraceae bacterium]